MPHSGWHGITYLKVAHLIWVFVLWIMVYGGKAVGSQNTPIFTTKVKEKLSVRILYM